MTSKLLFIRDVIDMCLINTVSHLILISLLSSIHLNSDIIVLKIKL